MIADPGVAVITGGASGIGFALAERFAGRGWSVVLADVDAAALEAAAARLAAEGAAVLAVPTDVGEEASVQGLADATVARFGVPTVVCNNAGVNAYGYRSWDAPAVTWRWIWDVNVMGVVHGLSAFVPLLLDAGRGHVVNTASVAGLASAPGIAPYAATKHAVMAISESLRLELAELGSPVGVTVVCPGVIATNIGQAARHWPARLGRPETLGPGGEAYAARLDAARAEAPGPGIVADAVLDAIEHDRFLVFPDDETEAQARAKHGAVFDELGAAPDEWF